MKKIIFLLLFILLLSYSSYAYAGCNNVPYGTAAWLICNPGAKVADIPTEISTAISSVNKGLIVTNGYVKTNLKEVRNATAVKDAMAAYKQFQNYESTYEKVDQFAGAIYGVATDASSVEDDLNNIRNLIYITPTNSKITPNGDLMDYINGDIGSDINIMNPNSTINNTTAYQQNNNMYQVNKSLSNEFLTTSNDDYLEGKESDTIANSIIKDENSSTNKATSLQNISIAKAFQLRDYAQLLNNKSLYSAYDAMKIDQDNYNNNLENSTLSNNY